MMSLKTQAVQLGHTYRLPVHILYKKIPGRLGGDLSFAEAIIAKYTNAEDRELPSANFVFPKFGESDAGAALTELSRQLILLNRIRIQMNLHNYRILERYSMTISARCTQLLNTLSMQTNIYSGVSEASVRELGQIHRELTARVSETVLRGAVPGRTGGRLPTVSGAIAKDVHQDEENALILRVLTAASRGNGARERYMRQLISRLTVVGSAEDQSASGPVARALLRKAEAEIFHFTEDGSSVSMTQWRSESARQFFWRIQRAPEPEKNIILEAGGFTSLVTFEKVLRTMDNETFRRFVQPLFERISTSLSEPVLPAEGEGAVGEYGDAEWLGLYHAAENVLAGTPGEIGGPEGTSGPVEYTERLMQQFTEESWERFSSQLLYADNREVLSRQAPELYRVLTEEGRSEEIRRKDFETVLRTMDRETFYTAVLPVLQRVTDTSVTDRESFIELLSADTSVTDRESFIERFLKVYEDHTEEDWEMIRSELFYGDNREVISKQAPELYRVLTGESTVESLSEESRWTAFETALQTMDRETFYTTVLPVLQRVTKTSAADRESLIERLSADMSVTDRESLIERFLTVYEDHTEEDWEVIRSELFYGDNREVISEQAPELYRVLTGGSSVESLSAESRWTAFETALQTMDRETFYTTVLPVLQRVTKTSAADRESLIERLSVDMSVTDRESLIERFLTVYEDHTEEDWEVIRSELFYGDSREVISKQAPELYRVLTGESTGESLSADSQSADSQSADSQSAENRIAENRITESRWTAFEAALKTMDRETFYTAVLPALQRVINISANRDDYVERPNFVFEEHTEKEFEQEAFVEQLSLFFEEHSEEDWELFRTELIHADREGELREQAPELYRALTLKTGTSSTEKTADRLTQISEEKELFFKSLSKEQSTVSVLLTLIPEAIRNSAVLLEDRKEPRSVDSYAEHGFSAVTGEYGSEYGDTEWLTLYHNAERVLTGTVRESSSSGAFESPASYTERLMRHFTEEGWEHFSSELIYADSGEVLSKQAPELYQVLTEERTSTENRWTSFENVLNNMDRETFTTFVRPILQRVTGPEKAERDRLVEHLSGFFEEHTAEDWEMFRSEMIRLDRNGEMQAQIPELYYTFSREKEGERTTASADGREVTASDEGSTERPDAGAAAQDRTREIFREKELLFRVLKEERGTIAVLRTLILEAIWNIAVIRENQKEFLTLAESIMDLTSEQWFQFKKDVHILHEEDLDIRQLIPETILRETVSEARVRALENNVQETEEQISGQTAILEGIRMSSEKMDFLRVLREETDRHDTVFGEIGRKMFLKTVLRNSDAGRLIRPSFREMSSEGKESWRNFVTELLHIDRRGPGSGPAGGGEYFGKLADQYGLAAGNEGSGTETVTRRETAIRILEERRRERILESEIIMERQREAERVRNTETHVFRLLASRPEGFSPDDPEEIPELDSADITVQRTTPNREAAEQSRNAEAVMREVQRRLHTESSHDIEFETVRHTTSETENSYELKEVTDTLERHEREIAGLLKAQKAGEERDLPREVMKQINDRLRMERLRSGR